MKQPRIVIAEDELAYDSVLFSREHSHYLRNVLRLKPGAAVRAVFRGTAYIVRLGDSDQGRLLGAVERVNALPQPESGLVIAFACVRPGPLEEILRHGTEVGVDRFIPLVTNRTSRRPVGSKDRWRTIVESACAQCGRGGGHKLDQTNRPAPGGVEHRGETWRYRYRRDGHQLERSGGKGLLT